MSTKKIALVTGGSRGLGRDMAIKIAKKGLDVILTYNGNQQKANETVAEIQSLGQKAVALQLSVNETRSFNDFAATVRKTLQDSLNAGTFDYLVNNAGIGINAPFAEISEEQFDTLV